MCRLKVFFLKWVDGHPLNFFCPCHPRDLERFEKIQPARLISHLHDLEIEVSLGTQYREGICPSHTDCFGESRRTWLSLPSTELPYAVCSPCVTEDRTTLRVDIRLAQAHIWCSHVLVLTQSLFLLSGYILKWPRKSWGYHLKHGVVMAWGEKG